MSSAARLHQAIATWALALLACGEVLPTDPSAPAPTTDPSVPNDDRVYAELLPIEVLGPPGTARHVRIALPTDRVGQAGSWRLAITLHNIVARDCAELVFNGQDPIDLSAPNLPFVRPTGGAMRGEIDLSAEMIAGENTLSFRYTRQVPDVSGFRILSLELLLDGEPVWALTDWDDPAAWTAPRSDPDTIESGRRFFQDESRDGGPTCARCHPHSGSDLQYYAFSNESIIARAMFHEFNLEESEAIASYIRGLDVPRDGRPYRAPFQPGADNHGAAGAELGAVLGNDAAFAQAAFGQAQLPDTLAWEWAADIDTFTLPTTIQLPTWFRWLPRFVDDAWFELDGGALKTAEADLELHPTLDTAHAFMNVAIELGKQLMIEHGDHHARIELLRFAATKLWDWSRHQDFYQPHHGFPDEPYGDQGHHGSPAYPYEVGFAFFEAEIAGHPHALAQAAEWWWLQIAVDPGRGRSNGSRPLNYADVLLAAEGLASSHELAFLHLLGSWEESRGPMEPLFGQDIGPVRLLETPLWHLEVAARTTLWLRFVEKQRQWIEGDGLLSAEHHALLAQAWTSTCSDMSLEQRQAVRAAAHPTIAELFETC